ncbi:hypothetical protein EON65_44295 [archaeon]|nr:MAG: hypothetical protein EON65_44295 [archaeon]
MVCWISSAEDLRRLENNMCMGICKNMGKSTYMRIRANINVYVYACVFAYQAYLVILMGMSTTGATSRMGKLLGSSALSGVKVHLP